MAIPCIEVELIQKIREVKKIIDNECEDCQEISACDTDCIWHNFIVYISAILNTADEKAQSDELESLF